MKKQCLRREPSDHFKTRRVILHPRGEGWDIQPYGEFLSFPQLQAIRHSGFIEKRGDARIFANLGVSLELILCHQGRRALALVQQRDVLKLISGYVPDHQLPSPLVTAWAELMEEVLPVHGEGCYGYSLDGEPLGDPYQYSRLSSLPVSETSFVGNLSTQSLTFMGQSSGWPVSFYIHQPTASLQLVFPVQIQLPESVTLVHVEDQLNESGTDVLSLFDPDSPVVLMELEESNEPSGKLFTLKDGEWRVWEQGQVQLSEYFSDPGKQLGRYFLQ